MFQNKSLLYNSKIFHRLHRLKIFPSSSRNMYNYFTPILEKKADHLTIHVDTNDSQIHNSNKIVNEILKLK